MLLKKEIPLFPWVGKEPIYVYLKKHINEMGKLPVEYEELPDATEFFSDQKFRWVGGAMDSLLGGMGGNSKSSENKARKLFKILCKQIAKPSDANRRALYLFVIDDEIIGYIDSLLKIIRREFFGNREQLKQEAIWFATKSAHRGPVKLGIALLGLFNCEEQVEILLTLGKHDEFTLYSVVAIQNGIEKSNQYLFELAKCVDGWGKINLIERLEADSEDIKDWLLRYGCRNRIMNEYLAYTCAVKGNLKDAIMKDEIDLNLYKGAGDIVDALINGGPAEDMDDYDQSMLLVVNYIRHSKKYAVDLGDFLVIANIRDYLKQEPEKWEKRMQVGWTEAIRLRCLEECQEILERPFWLEQVWKDIESKDNLKHYNAVQAGRILKLDIWPKLFQQLINNPQNSSLYYEVMRTSDRERINQVINFAENNLPLSQIATGPKDEMGLGLAFQAHNCLDFIIQDLKKFEGLGKKLLSSALLSPVIRNRNLAMGVLEAWKPESWPEDAKGLLIQLKDCDPDKELRIRAGNLLKKLDSL